MTADAGRGNVRRPNSAVATASSGTPRSKSVRIAGETAVVSGGGVEALVALAQQRPPSAPGLGRRPLSSGPRRPLGPPPAKLDPRRQTTFTRLLEHTVDTLRGDRQEDHHEELGRTLADVRKSFDEVRYEADRCAKELQEVRKEIKRREAELAAHPEYGVKATMTRENVLERLEQVAVEIDRENETHRVYQHLVGRTGRELNLVKEKVAAMERHVQRKEKEVVKYEDSSLRTHQNKVQALQELEYLEYEVDTERRLCGQAIQDLHEDMHHREDAVGHRQNFEAWRYQVAKKAASDAFQATAGRFRKIYALEKLTGNCLQKNTMECFEASQKTEDSFQNIKEVTGLKYVMDIVHKFLTKDVEVEQLKKQVQDTELRLERLRKEEAERQSEGGSFELYDRTPGAARSCLNNQVAEREVELAKAQNQHEELQRHLTDTTVMLDNVLRWAQKTHSSFRAMGLTRGEAETETIPDLAEHFDLLAQTVEGFLTRALDNHGAPNLVKRTTKTMEREFRDQEHLLEDKEFHTRNCRVHPSTDDARRFNQGQPQEEERQNEDQSNERARLKKDGRDLLKARLPERSARAPPGSRRRTELHQGSAEEAGGASCQAAGEAGGGGGEGGASAKRGPPRVPLAPPRPTSRGGWARTPR